MVQTKMEQSVELSESTESNVLEIYRKVWDATQIYENFIDFSLKWILTKNPQNPICLNFKPLTYISYTYI